ncbi:MAG: adenine deaminase [Anaerorhabdus sp.]
MRKFNKELLLKCARGEINADSVIYNAKVVNVITGEIIPGDIFIKDGYISHVEYYNLQSDLDKADKQFDAKGKYLAPGFIDSHVHIESSMLTPRNFAKAVLPWGTTTVVTDPHEIGNVLGVEGVKYMHDSASDLPLKEFIDIPSCVPSVPGLEFAGADFTSREISELAKLERVIGLAEVMDYLAVINGEKRMMDILRVAEENSLYIQGHAPGVSNRDLSAYIIGGPKTCHETRHSAEALEKLRSGMFIDSRESSITKNVRTIWEGVKNIRYFDHLCFCTDDRESDDILKDGHMNDVVNIAIDAGMHPIDAIKSATYNTAREIKNDHLGAIVPGYLADIILFDDLNKIVPTHVFVEGEQVAKDQELLVDIADKEYDVEKINSVCIKDLVLDDLVIKAPINEGSILCNVMDYNDKKFSISKLSEIEIPVKNGILDISFDDNLKFVAVINRYKNNDNIALHVVKNFGTNRGAIASTVSHDSHNLTIVYDNKENALVAANRLKEVGGGMVAVDNGKVLETLELPLAGLISLKDAKSVAQDAKRMKDANYSLGLTEIENPLLRIVSLALPVIPEVKMSDLGLVDVLKKELIPLFKK